MLPTTRWLRPTEESERHCGRSVLRQQLDDVHQHPVPGGAEAFLKYYLGQIDQYWESLVGVAVPAPKSIADSAAYTKDPNQVKIVKEWIPVCKTYAALKKESFAALARSTRRKR